MRWIQGGIMVHRIRRWLLAVVACHIALSMPPWAHCQRVPGGPRVPALNLDDTPESDDETPESRELGVFRKPPRELQRYLDRAHRAIDRSDYNEAVDLLAALLERTSASPDAPLDSDFLMAPSSNGTAQDSLRTAAWQMLRTLPPAALELYELRLGTDAADALQKATAQQDFEQLRAVAARYRQTRAGNEAMMLLGRSYLDRGEPRAAVRCFDALLPLPSTTESTDPQLSLLRAVALFQSGQMDLARDAFQRLQQTRSTIRTAAAEYTLASELDSLEQLSRLVGPIRHLAPASLHDWPIHRGSADRNPVSAVGGIPLSYPHWRTRVSLVSPDEERHLLEEKESLERTHQASMPSLSPLAVDDTVLMRSTDRLVAIDFESGKYLWEWPWDDTTDAYTEDFEHSVNNSEGLTHQRLDDVAQRVWDDAPYGQLSSDGNAVYLLQGFGHQLEASQENGPFATSPDALTNELVALDLKSQGKFLWRVGGSESTQEPILAGTFFTGPPLPYAGSLYIIGETRGEVVLFCLASQSGKLQWSQQLTFVQTGLQLDPLRRMLGASPSLQDDILVCPTSCGAVVAVDLTTRQLLWGYQYPRVDDHQPSRAIWSIRSPSFLPRNNRWLDASAMLSSGSAILSPPESNQLHCLDLETGKLRWTLPRVSQEKNEEWWFAATIHHDKVITVGPRHVAAWNLIDGTPAWPQPLAIPDDAVPTGRGFLHAGRYFLPASTPSLLEIDIEHGSVSVHRLPATLGNTINYREHLLSQTPTELISYYQRDALEREVERRLATAPHDPWALEHKGQLEQSAGHVAQAVELYRLALAQFPSHDARRAPIENLLFDALLSQLRTDITNLDIAREAESLTGSPQQELALLRLKIERFLAVGNPMLAAAELWQMNEIAGDPRTWRGTPEGTERRLTLDPAASTHEARWLTMRFKEVWEQSSLPQRLELDLLAAKIFEAIRHTDSSTEIERFVTVFQGFPTATTATRTLAESYSRRNDLLGAELLLRSAFEPARSNSQWWTAPDALPIAAMLGESFQKSNQSRALADVVKLLQAEGNGGAATWQDGTSRVWAERFSQWLRDDSAPPWADGKVDVQVNVADVAPENGMTQESIPVRRMNGGDGIPWTAHTDRQMQLTLRNARGEDAGQIRLRTISDGVGPQIEIGQFGPMLAVATNGQLTLLDTSISRGNSQDMVRWTHKLNATVTTTFEDATASAFTNWPWGERRVNFSAFPRPRPQLMARLGPVLPQGVCIANEGRLVCVSPLTGETVWERPLISRKAELWGDSEIVVVAYNDRDKAQVVSLIDGELLGERQIPPSQQRWTTVGRQVLAWGNNPVEKTRTLQMLDPWTTKVVWSVTCPETTKGTIVDEEELALMQPSGRFVVYDLRTGDVQVEGQLEPEPELTSIAVTRSDSQYFVMTNGRVPAESRPPTERITSITPTPSTPIYGRVYAFSRQGSGLQWPVPAFIDQYFPVRSLARDVPLLVFARNKQSLAEPNRRTTEVLVLDARDGRLLWEGARPATGRHELKLVSDPSTQHARLYLADGATVLDIHFTSAPRAPAPPAQTGRAASRLASSSSLRNIMGAVSRAFGSLNPLQVDDQAAPEFQEELLDEDADDQDANAFIEENE
ncbi:MAG: PQQ-binding-like beta-propeller repeat protein [Planctomycetota bacterium]|nr:PQQ-binding-like beta-propeller repeat protein [Planctomycetota bacterium]